MYEAGKHLNEKFKKLLGFKLELLHPYGAWKAVRLTLPKKGANFIIRLRTQMKRAMLKRRLDAVIRRPDAETKTLAKFMFRSILVADHMTFTDLADRLRHDNISRTDSDHEGSRDGDSNFNIGAQ